MSIEHHLRVSDEDRERLIDALQRHTGAGRLSLDEYADRVDQVLLARTHGELAAVVRDLPPEPVAASTVDQTAARHLMLAFLAALIVLTVIGVAVAAFR